MQFMLSILVKFPVFVMFLFYLVDLVDLVDKLTSRRADKEICLAALLVDKQSVTSRQGGMLCYTLKYTYHCLLSKSPGLLVCL